jgi:polysaccharide deacetylase family protein (PEP-CTERM system associated)
MTVDVEEHFQVSAFEGSIRREDWSRMSSRVEQNTSRLLDLFDGGGVKATFFVLGWVGEQCPRLVRAIAERGHEIASHGYSHRLIYAQSPAEFRDETERSRRILEDACGHRLEGYRAASFSIRGSNLWALDVLAESGFRYDSSLFPVVHDRYGIPGAPRRIHRLRTPSGAELVEVPPTTVRVGPMTLPVAGGGYLRLYPRWLTRWAIGRLNRRESMPAMVYVHPWEVDPEQPPMHGPAVSRFRHYTGLRGTADKLRDLMARFRFGPVREVIALAGIDAAVPQERSAGNA